MVFLNNFGVGAGSGAGGVGGVCMGGGGQIMERGGGGGGQIMKKFYFLNKFLKMSDIEIEFSRLSDFQRLTLWNVGWKIQIWIRWICWRQQSDQCVVNCKCEKFTSEEWGFDSLVSRSWLGPSSDICI